MSLISWTFAGFFGLCLLIYHLPFLKELRVYVLLAASLACLWLFGGLIGFVWLLLTALATYACALRLNSKSGKFFYWLGVLFPLLVLGYFKYANFIASAVGLAMKPVVLLAGISFYTFKVVSYLTDVKRGLIAPERNFLAHLLYVSYFPQLLSGPIERAGLFKAQLREAKRLNASRFNCGLAQVLWGLFKKMAVADSLATLVNPVFNAPAEYSGFVFVLALFGYTFQIYCDFSGYSDLAIGMSRLLGLNLMDNFRTPYFSKSLKEFWGRWHISLSTWFRDYVYIPLGGGRCASWRVYCNLMVTFLLSGLWHGANWTFIFWGGLHGLWLCLEKFCCQKRAWSATALGQWFWAVLTFLLVVFAWLFFRAASLGDAFSIIKGAFMGIGDPMGYLSAGFATFFKELGPAEMAKYPVLLAGLFVFEFRWRQESPWAPLAEGGKGRLILYYALVVLALLLWTGEPQQMIYGQF